MYGQTGSGKTYSMLGAGFKPPPKRPGSVRREGSLARAKPRKTPSGVPLPRPPRHQRVSSFSGPVAPPPQKEEEGVLLKSLKLLLESTGSEYTVECSYFEVYKEQVFDLLNQDSLGTSLPMYEDTSREEFFVKGLFTVEVNDLEDCKAILKQGETSRHYASTKMNHQSSRSHTVFRI